MLQDDITLDLFTEVNILVEDVPTNTVRANIIQEASTYVNVESQAVIVIDFESMGINFDDYANRYGKVGKILLFTKAVSGYKTTFGSVSLGITNDIETNGTAYIDPNNHNIVGIPIVFTKVVAGQKTTFGKTSLLINNIIQTNGVNTIGEVNFYGSGLYGDGFYSRIGGYGDGAYGFGIYPGASISLAIGFGSNTFGDLVVTETSVAEISLSDHGIPATRTNHKIKLRARTTTGSTGVIKAALYEGTTNISGDLTTIPLSNTLEDYALPIPDELAANITDYSQLSIKFWGYDAGGNSLVFEIADIYLELPVVSGPTYFGAVSSSLTFGKSVSGSITNKKTSTAEISLAPHGLPFSRTNHTIKLRARTTTGSTGVIKAALYEGAVNRSGDLITNPLTNSFADYTLVILDADAATITDYSNLSIKFWGFDINNQALVFEISKLYLELPAATGNTTHYGSVSRSTTFTKSVSGVINSKRTTTAEISLASHGTPSARTNHSIKVRARTTTGSTGVLKAELYEGSTVRSGATPLSTSSLTNTLTDYTLAIPNDAAASITSYSNLSIKFWGFDSAGNALVFEVSEIYLELPTP